MLPNPNSTLRGGPQSPVSSFNESNVPSTSSSSVASTNPSPTVVRQSTSQLPSPASNIRFLKPRGCSADSRRSLPAELEPKDEVEVKQGSSLANGSCEMCKNYEGQLQALQKEHTSVNNRLSATVAELHSVKKLNEEVEIRANAEKALFQEKTVDFEERITQMSQRMDGLLKNYQEYRRSSEAEFARLAREREAAQLEILDIEEHYQTLLGKRRNAAAEMAAPINLPTEKTDLELYALQMREDLLSINVAREHLMQRLDAQTASHRAQLTDERGKRMQSVAMLQKRLTDAEEQIENLTRINEVSKQSAAARAAAERAAEQASIESKQYKMKSEQLSQSLTRSVEEISQLKAKISSLQNDLITSEAVQKDFVGLSQHLQMELEKQREQTHELRWQDADDVFNCASCSQPFGPSSIKQNCRHCGRILCQACLTKQLPPEGSRTRYAAVCDMCHTLLVKDAAPYFSRVDFNKKPFNNNPSTSGSASTAVGSPAPRLIDRIIRGPSETTSSTPPLLPIRPPMRPPNRPNRT